MTPLAPVARPEPPGDLAAPPTPAPRRLPMLNYIWAGLIVLSFGFALYADIGDAVRDTYRNGEA